MKIPRRIGGWQKGVHMRILQVRLGFSRKGVSWWK
jgi:hypothetical protein